MFDGVFGERAGVVGEAPVPGAGVGLFVGGDAEVEFGVGEGALREVEVVGLPGDGGGGYGAAFKGAGEPLGGPEGAGVEVLGRGRRERRKGLPRESGFEAEGERGGSGGEGFEGEEEGGRVW